MAFFFNGNICHFPINYAKNKFYWGQIISVKFKDLHTEGVLLGMSSQKITQNLRLEKWVEQCIFDIYKNINHSFYMICIITTDFMLRCN